jgi:hypothetical protein
MAATSKKISGFWLTLARADGLPDNKLSHLYMIGRIAGFDFYLPKYKGTRRDVTYLNYQYRGSLPLIDAVRALADSLGQANRTLDGSELVFS